MVWEEMSYNKYQEVSMTQRLREEYESDYIYEIYIYMEILKEEEIDEPV